MRRTFQETLVLRKLGRVIKLPKILGLLCEIFPLDKRIPLLSNNVRGGTIQLCDSVGQIDALNELEVSSQLQA